MTKTAYPGKSGFTAAELTCDRPRWRARAIEFDDDLFNL